MGAYERGPVSRQITGSIQEEPPHPRVCFNHLSLPFIIVPRVHQIDVPRGETRLKPIHVRPAGSPVISYIASISLGQEKRVVAILTY